MREAIPVGRFSSSPQEQGDSEARQQKAIRRILSRHKLRLSTRFNAIFDRSKSAFKGEHLTIGNLGKFLQQVKDGLVTPDAKGEMPVLCFEAVDRLTRLHPLEATDLLRQFVDAGLALVFDEADLWIDRQTIGDKWIMLQVLIEQAWRYSQRLSGRMLSSWEAKRKSGKPTTTTCPKWLRWDARSSKFVKNDFASTLKEACLLSIAGHGASEIRKQLGLTTAPQNLTKLFHKPELMGHHQHKKRNADGTRSPVGEVITNYYPPLLTEQQFYQLQEVLHARNQWKGRRGEHCTNLFTHLLINKADGTELMVKKQSRNNPAVLVSQAKLRGSSSHAPLHYQIVEDALLTLFIRLKKHDLAPQGKTAENKADKLKAELQTLNYRLNQFLEKQLDHPEHDYAKLIDGLHSKVKRVQEQLADERMKHPPAETLNHTQDAIDFMAGLSGPELLDARVRAKNLIRQLVKTIEVGIRSAQSAAFTVRLTDGTSLRGETTKLGKFHVTIRDAV